MSVTLSPELEKRVQDHVKSGAYTSPHEVLEKAFRLLLQREKQEEILRATEANKLDQ